MKETNKKTIELLNSIDEKFFIDMTEPLRLGNAETVLLNDKSVLINNRGIWQFYAQDNEHVKEIVNYIKTHCKKDNCTITVHGEFGRKECQDSFPITWSHPCFVSAYFSKEKKELNPSFEIRKLTQTYADFVSKTYGLIKDNPDSLKQAKEAIEMGMIGLFVGGQIVGFIGTHQEGSMGMLEVLPEFRKHGYGETLEKALINDFLDAGKVPFAHIIVTNSISLALQKKLGMWTSEKSVFWLGY